MRVVVAAGLAFCLSSCSTGGHAAFPPKTGGVRLADPAFAARFSHQSAPLVVPFQLDRAGLSATALAADYLTLAEANGATFVSDLTLALHFKHDGVPIECVSQIVVGAPAPAATDAVAGTGRGASDEDIYATTVRPWQPDAVTAWVDDRDRVCKKVAHQEIVDRPVVEDRFDVEVARYIPPGGVPIEHTAVLVYSDECHLETRHREVQRYEHFIATRITPFDLAQLGAYADEALTESPPVCHELRAGEKPAQRISGTLHFTGPLGVHAPEVWVPTPGVPKVK